jgi:MFS family permease
VQCRERLDAASTPAPVGGPQAVPLRRSRLLRPGRIAERLPPALGDRNYRLFLGSVLASGFGTQIVAVAVGWQVYAIHGSAFDLGLIGLAEFVPQLALALPAGHLADRFPRRTVLAVSVALEAATTSLLIVVSVDGARELWPFLALATAIGAASVIGAPPQRALPTALAPPELLASAMALRSVVFQLAVVAGPALGGFLFAAGPVAAYATATGFLVISLVCTVALREPVARGTSIRATGLDGVLAGIRFIRRSPVILGAITLDLFAVLFGGAIALAPLYARTILHTGPLGLGLLRSAPAVGALAAGALLTHSPLRYPAGRTLLSVVAAFGVSMVVFGLSRSLPLSLAALAVSGFVDMFSMNIRATAVALATPDALRGRVLAVENVFIGASNELGAFESGAAAALLGPVAAVVAGGAITIGLAAVWRWVFPGLARIGRLEDLAPEQVEPVGSAM